MNTKNVLLLIGGALGLTYALDKAGFSMLGKTIAVASVSIMALAAADIRIESTKEKK